MKETLHIKNFGPIKDVKLELGKVNVLIGDQGTGKSTVAKVLAAIRNTIFLELFNLKIVDESRKETEKFIEYLKIFGLYSYLQNESELILKHAGFNFIYRDGNVIHIERASDRLSDALIYGHFNYIPTERILISTLSDFLFALIEIKAEIPRLILRFGDKFSKGRKSEKKNYQDILGVDFIHIDGVNSIVLKDDKVVPLSDGSSGIQGTIPLLVVFDLVTGEMNSRSDIIDVGPLLVIEEPESNLFPQTQKKLLNYLIYKNFGQEINLDSRQIEKYFLNQLLITTHSPYILTSLNNLMYAFTVGESHNEKANAVIEKKYWLNPDDVSAYMMLTDGTCEDIMDRDEGMIKAEKIDEVSGFLNRQFDELLSIEHSKG